QGQSTGRERRAEATARHLVGSRIKRCDSLIRGEQRVRTRAFRASSQQKYDNAPQEKFDCDMRARAFDSARERRPLLAQRAAKGRRARRRQPIRTASGAARLFSQTRGKYGDSEDRG